MNVEIMPRSLKLQRYQLKPFSLCGVFDAAATSKLSCHDAAVMLASTVLRVIWHR